MIALVAACAPILAFGLVVHFWPSIASTGVFVVSFTVVFIGGTGAYFVWSQISIRRLQSKLIANNRRYCLYCFFDLRGLDKTGTCPECGEPYEIWKVQNEWREGDAQEQDLG